MSKQSRRGSIWEVAIERDAVERGFPAHVERKHGAKDEGDIHGIPGVVVEAKNCARYELPGWVAEAEAEAVNAGEPCGVVFMKRKGIGLTHIDRHLCVMSIGTFYRLYDVLRGMR